MEEIDLGLALVSTNRNSSSSSSDAGAGAGVNANLTFAASDDPLSELVWSSHNGLSLKCTDSSIIVDKMPSHLQEDGQSSKCVSISQSIESKWGRNENIVDKGESNGKMEEETGTIGSGQKDKDNKGNEEEDMCSSQNVLMTDVAESNKIKSGQDNLADGNHDHEVDIAIKEPSSNENSRIETNTNIIAPLVNKLPEEHELIKNKSRNNPLAAVPLKELEFSAENDLSRTTAKEGHSIGETNKNSLSTSSRIRLCQEKGKQKALSGDRYAKSTNNSHESVESCNSARLCLRGIKRLRHDEETEIESKRMKGHGSSSSFGPDSSFVNWISNMVKGRSDSNEREFPSLVPTLAFPNEAYSKTHPENLTDNNILRGSANLSKGFRSMFQSMYSPKTKVFDNGVEKEDYLLEGTKEPSVSERASCERRVVNNTCKEIIVANNAVPSKPWIFSACEVELLENKKKSEFAEDNTTNIQPAGKCTNPRSSLWITRLYSQTPKLRKCNQQVTRGGSKDNVFSMDQKNTEVMGVSEAMISRRLDTLNHIIPSKSRNHQTSSVICFFCGKSGHDIRDCPEVTKTELVDLLLKIGSFKTVEVSPSLCIRCLSRGHWASSCPRQSEKEAPFISYLSLNVKKSPRKKHSTSNEVRKSTSSNSENGLKYEQGLLLSKSVNAKKIGAPEEMCLAIKKLRLSRGNILRWINSDVSSSNINGFFLRLRLGKFEVGVSGTGYYVACIVGDAREHEGCRSSKSISVDIGGTKVSVGSQYISNKDFLEGEIDDWWCRIMKSGGKIPSLEELNSKLEDKKSFN